MKLSPAVLGTQGEWSACEWGVGICCGVGPERCRSDGNSGDGPRLIPVSAELEAGGRLVLVSELLDRPFIPRAVESCGAEAGAAPRSDGWSKKLKSSSVKADSSKSIPVGPLSYVPPLPPAFILKPIPIPISISKSISISIPRYGCGCIDQDESPEPKGSNDALPGGGAEEEDATASGATGVGDSED